MGAGCSATVVPGQAIAGAATLATLSTTKVQPVDPTAGHNQVAGNQVAWRLMRCIDGIWNDYDTDGNGELDSKEFAILVGGVMTQHGSADVADLPTADEIQELLQMADEDGDGSISRHEFTLLMTGFADMSADQRIEMAELSGSFCKLMMFAECILAKYAGENAQEEEEEEEGTSLAAEEARDSASVTPLGHAVTIVETPLPTPTAPLPPFASSNFSFDIRSPVQDDTCPATKADDRPPPPQHEKEPPSSSSVLFDEATLDDEDVAGSGFEELPV